MGKYVKDILATHDIPVTTMIITRELRNDPGITVSDLARKTGIVKSHISNLIREMDERGWVGKTPG